MAATAGRSDEGAPQQGAARRLVIELDIVSVAYLVAAALVGLAVLAVFRIAPSTITKVAVGVLLAFALDPLVVRARRRFRWSRSTAVAFVSAGLIAVFAAAAVLLGPAAAREARGLATDLPATVERLYDWPLVGDPLAEAEAAERVERWIDELPARLDDRTVADIADTVLRGIQTLALVLVVAVAVMVDGEVLVARARRLLPPGRRARADQLGRIVYRTVGNYFAGSLLVATINGLVILTAGLLLGVPLAPLAGLWATLTNLIPQIGGFLGGGFFVLLAVTEGPVVGLIAAVVFLLYQQIENNVVAPSIVGKAVNLSPPATMLAALVGGAAAGVPGALAATPLVGTVKAIYLELRHGPPAPEVQALSPKPAGRWRRRRSRGAPTRT